MKNLFVFILTLVLLLCFSCYAEMNLVKDFVTDESVSYVWIGDINCNDATLRIDYPEYGVIEAQNIRLELNDLPTIMLWHDKSATCAVFNLKYTNGEIVAIGACGDTSMIMDNLVVGVKDTDKDMLAWGAIAGNVIPAGTRIRIWSDEK